MLIITGEPVGLAKRIIDDLLRLNASILNFWIDFWKANLEVSWSISRKKHKKGAEFASSPQTLGWVLMLN